MNIQTANMIRFIFSRYLNTQHEEFAECLQNLLSDEDTDQMELIERYEAFQQLEGWIACHGLELITAPSLRYDCGGNDGTFQEG